jgi:hypothetical protein
MPLSPAEQSAKDMQQLYKNVFSSAEGRLVLADILNMGHVFDIIDPPEDVVKVADRNFALIIARMAGAFDIIYTQLGMTKEN